MINNDGSTVQLRSRSKRRRRSDRIFAYLEEDERAFASIACRFFWGAIGYVQRRQEEEGIYSRDGGRVPCGYGTGKGVSNGMGFSNLAYPNFVSLISGTHHIWVHLSVTQSQEKLGLESQRIRLRLQCENRSQS
jgi:hypothetical protein